MKFPKKVYFLGEPITSEPFKALYFSQLVPIGADLLLARITDEDLVLTHTFLANESNLDFRSGIDVTHMLKKKAPHAKVVVISTLPKREVIPCFEGIEDVLVIQAPDIFHPHLNDETGEKEMSLELQKVWAFFDPTSFLQNFLGKGEERPVT